MDEFTVAMKARRFVSEVGPTVIPVSVGVYATHSGAVIRLQNDLDPNEPGWSFKNGGKHYICVNSKDRPERQRFTICHELAHIVLGLPSDHSTQWWSYSKRAPDEISCDVFAAELLLPYRLFKAAAEKEEISLETIDALAESFGASFTATGSRFASVVSTPCAFVLSEGGKVRYASRSTSLRQGNAFIPTRIELPPKTASARARARGTHLESDEIDAEDWFSDWERGGTLAEEARHLGQWDQTLTLLWFEDEEAPQPVKYRDSQQAEDDELLKELDGNLSWKGKRRRR